MSAWTHTLTKAELDARYALTASLDMGFARKQREFYERQTPAALRSLQMQAWAANDSDGYQMAASHLALMEAA